MKKENIWNSFHNKNIKDKIDTLIRNNIINNEFTEILTKNKMLDLSIAEQISENVIGTFSFPFSIVPNFLINGINYNIPMVTEEPSVVAACSYAGKLISKCGGFNSVVLNRKMIGQVALFDIDNFNSAISSIMENKETIISLANSSYPSIVKRGGGALDLKIKILENSLIDEKQKFLVVYIFIDVKDAMGANIVNTMTEGIKSFLEKITNGKSLMSILSNYATESLVTSKCEINIKYLSNDINKAKFIAKKIELASKFAKMDVHRAATHNKGILNGIDAVVIATGNDFRAIEAGCHSYAVKNHIYQGLSTWIFDESSEKLIGELTVPMPIASVGGSIGLNPKVKLSFDLLNNPDAKTLSTIIVSVGLAQNFAAIKALVSSGIQKGHMKMQARSLALLSGAKEYEIELVVNKLLDEKYINLETSKNILNTLRNNKI